MRVFKYETTFENKTELINEIKDLLWKMEHTWPIFITSGKMTQNLKDYITNRTDESIIKVGYRKTNIE